MIRRYRKVQGFIYDTQGEGEGLLDLSEIENRLNTQHEENINLKQALWEAEVNYYEERCDNIIDYEAWIEYLKEEWSKKYWNMKSK